MARILNEMFIALNTFGAKVSNQIVGGPKG